jgi:hypothetical protein
MKLGTFRTVFRQHAAKGPCEFLLLHPQTANDAGMGLVSSATPSRKVDFGASR